MSAVKLHPRQMSLRATVTLAMASVAVLVVVAILGTNFRIRLFSELLVQLEFRIAISAIRARNCSS